jgi:hypothetical protein
MCRFLSFALLALLHSGLAVAEEGWVSLFDGTTLTGWTQLNGTATYRVEEGAIIGKTAEGSPNSFLCSDKAYGNFDLTFEVKIYDNALNSGIQIRSKTKDLDPNNKTEKAGRVYGPQCELEASGGNGAEAGYIYGEATGRGWLTPKERLLPHKHMKDGEWNSIRVLAEGVRIQTWINGQAIEDISDEEIFKTHPAGFLGLQVHGIAKGTGPYQVAWRNIKIKTL